MARRWGAPDHSLHSQDPGWQKPLHAAIDVAAGATDEIVAAPGAGKKIVMLGYVMGNQTGAGAMEWKSASTTLTASMSTNRYITQNTPYCTMGIMVCAANEALNLTSTASVLRGACTYVVIDA